VKARRTKLAGRSDREGKKERVGRIGTEKRDKEEKETWRQGEGEGERKREIAERVR